MNTPDPVQCVLDAIKNVKPSGDGWSGRCPAHDDRHNSLTIHRGADGRALVKCHAGEGCPTDRIVAALGLTMAVTCSRIATTPPGGMAKSPDRGHLRLPRRSRRFALSSRALRALKASRSANRTGAVAGTGIFAACVGSCSDSPSCAPPIRTHGCSCPKGRRM